MQLILKHHKDGIIVLVIVVIITCIGELFKALRK